MDAATCRGHVAMCRGHGSEASGDSGGAQHAVGQTPLPAGGKVEAAASPPSPGAESDAGSSDTDSETERVGCYIVLY